jgi:hypothetical protein
MTTLILGAKAGLAVLLLVAGGAKLADLAGFEAAIRQLVPGRRRQLGPVAAPAIAAAELAAGVASLCWPALGFVNVAVLGLAIGFAVVAAAGYARRRGQPCRCFGALTRRAFGRRELGQSVAIMAAAAIAARPVVPATVQLAGAAHLLLLCGAGLTVLAAFTAARALQAGRTEPEGVS